MKCPHSLQLCPTLCDPTEGGLPGSAIHGIFQARILEWAAISFSSGPFQPRDRTRVSVIADALLSEPPGKPVLMNERPQRWIEYMGKVGCGHSTAREKHEEKS